MTRLPLTVLAWEGPQARAYLVRMRRAGLAPARIVVMVRNPWRERRPGAPGLDRGMGLRWAERHQARRHNFHPLAIRKRHPELVARIAAAMEAVGTDPSGAYREMFDDFAYDHYAPEVIRVAAASYRDPAVLATLTDLARQDGGRLGTVLFTGGGIVPAPVFEVPGIRIVHVHTGFLPHVRGADVLLWSLLVRGRPGVSAFVMAPGLDEGDVLAARELAPLVVDLGAMVRPDDDTLYRAVFSFIDPLVRAELLVADVLEPAAGGDAPAGTPQDLEQGVTYHFMHPVVRSRALARLFSSPRGQAPARVAPAARAARYQRYYERPSVIAPIRFALDAALTRAPLRARGIRNRQRDYAALTQDPDRLALHARLNRLLARQEEEWGSYDYGEGYFYQSSDELGITGLRDTGARVAAFGLRDLCRDRRALEIGCNSGFLSLAIAPVTRHVVGFELNPHLVAMAQAGAAYLAVDNVDLRVCAFEDFPLGEVFDDVLSFANHHTYDGNTRQSLDEYFARCHALTAPGGRLVFESHPPELEGDGFGHTLALIERYYDVERSEIHEYGTPLDAGRRFVVGIRRERIGDPR